MHFELSSRVFYPLLFVSLFFLSFLFFNLKVLYVPETIKLFQGDKNLQAYSSDDGSSIRPSSAKLPSFSYGFSAWMDCRDFVDERVNLKLHGSESRSI